MEWGTVYWHQGERRPYITVSSKPFLDGYSRVTLARGTLHSTSTTAQIARSGKVSPIPRRIPLGEAAVVFADTNSPAYYPNTGDFHLTLVQGCQLTYCDKAALLDPTVYRPIDRIQPAYRAAMAESLRSALHGPPFPMPAVKPNTRRPTLLPVTQGSLVHVRTTHGIREFVVISHPDVHEYYPVAALLLVPVYNSKATDIFERYSFDQLESLSAYARSAHVVDVVGTIAETALQELLDIVDLALDGEFK